MSITPEHPRAETPRTGRVLQIVLVLFCLELGLVLLLMPWTLLWDNNFFLTMGSHWHEFWMNSYVRGAVSGVGVVNLWIAVQEALKLRR